MDEEAFAFRESSALHWGMPLLPRLVGTAKGSGWFKLGAVCFIVFTVLLVKSTFPSHLRSVLATRYATLTFDGLLTSNAVQYGSFSISNRHGHPLNFYVNNLEVRTRQGWRVRFKWTPGSEAHPILGRLDNRVATGATQSFLVPVPETGEAWRIHLGVLRGVQGLTLKDRAMILLKTRSPVAAFSTNPRLTTAYHRFTFAGMLDGPRIPMAAAAVVERD